MTAFDTDHLTHDHHFLGSSHDANARKTLWVVALTAVMMVGEIIAGTVFGSMALLADGFHMATHAGALAVAAGAYAYAKRHADNRRFSFGTGKVGDLAGFASALVLGIVAVGIAGESVGRLFDPRPVAFSQATLVAVLGLAVNLVSALLLAGGGHHHHHHGHHHHDDHDDHDHGHGQNHRDNNLRSAYFHVLADALTSVLAIIALVAGRYLGWVWLDPLMGIVGAIVIARWSWSLCEHRRRPSRHHRPPRRGRGARTRRGSRRRADHRSARSGASARRRMRRSSVSRAAWPQRPFARACGLFTKSAI